MVAKRTQHAAPNNVATCCVGMLRSFGRVFMIERAISVRLLAAALIALKARRCFCDKKLNLESLQEIRNSTSNRYKKLVMTHLNLEKFSL